MSAVAHRLVEAPAIAARTKASALSAIQLSSRLVSGGEWDALMGDFDEACQEQMHAFAAARWPGVVLEPMVFERDGVMVGGTLIMVQKLPLGLSSIALCKWGPVLKTITDPDADALRAGMVEALIASYARGRGMMLSLLPLTAVEPRNAAYDALMARGFQPGTVLSFPDRYIVNLRLDDAAQRKSFHQTWRRQLAKAEKSELSFEHAGPERLGEFDALYQAMTDRKQFPDHSAYDTVPALMATPVASLRPELFFVRHAGEIVAGALIFKAGKRAVYLYGATNDQALPLRAGYFLHWNIIRWLRDHTRADWYDLGGTDGFQGLHQFKKGMVGAEGVIEPVPPVANFATSPLAFLLGNGAFLGREFYHKTRNKLVALMGSKAKPDQGSASSDEQPS